MNRHAELFARPALVLALLLAASAAPHAEGAEVVSHAAEPRSHADSAEPRSHAESAEGAEVGGGSGEAQPLPIDSHWESAETEEQGPPPSARSDAEYFLDLLEWQKRDPGAFAEAGAALAASFATDAPDRSVAGHTCPAPPACEAVYIPPVSFVAAREAAEVIEQTPMPPLPPAAPPPPPPAVFTVGPDWTPNAAAAPGRVRRDPADLPTNTCFTAEELSRMFDPDDPALASTNALERALALDWRDRFAEAWALLREEEARPDADPALLLLAANYRLYGRPGVADLLDPERPGLYRAALQGEARETLRRVAALGADTNAPPRTLYLAARARALLAPASFAEEGERTAEVLALLRRAENAPRPSREDFFWRRRAGDALRRGAFAQLGGLAADPGVLPEGPENAADPYEYAPRKERDERQWSFLCGIRDSVLARHGADAMAELAALFLGADRETGRAWGHAVLALDPAWGEWWARRAAIRGNAAARAAFEGGRFASPEAIPDPHIVSRSVSISGGWHPHSPLAGAPGMGAGGWIEPYEETPALAEKCAPLGLRPFWFRRDLPPEGTPIGDDIRRLNARAAEDGGGRKTCNNALPARIPFLLFLPPPAACTGAVPLVVYLPGNGEQGTDLAKQFRQTACIGKVCSAAFQAAHPAALLVPMPPDWGNWNISRGWPQDAFGPQAELFSDLVLAVARGSAALGGPAIDPARVHLTGLGSGGAIAAGMAFDHPGRFASVSGAWFSPYCDPGPARPGAWWIAQEDEDRDEDEQLEWEEILAQRIKPFQAAVRAAGGSCEYREYPALPGAWWWDRMWRDDDAFWDWMLAQRSPGEIHPEGAPIPRFLFGHEEAAEAGGDSGAEPPSVGFHAENAESAEVVSHAESAEVVGRDAPTARPNLEPANQQTSKPGPAALPPDHPAEAAAGAQRPPASEAAILLASLAADGTAVFWGAETNGAFCPPTFAASARFRAGEAAATALSNAVRLVVVNRVRSIPDRAFAGLPALRSVVLPYPLSAVGPGAFADCASLANVIRRGNAPLAISADAFAGCPSALTLAFAERKDTARAAWPDGPVPFVRGLGGSVYPGCRMDGAADWLFPDGAARYTGPRVEGAYLFRVRSDGTAALIRKLDPDAPDPDALDGAPVVQDEDDRGYLPHGEMRRSEGDFLFRLSETPYGGRLRVETAELLRYTGTNEILKLPVALGGRPLDRIAGAAFAGTPVRGLRLPASVRSFTRWTARKKDALEAIWCDGAPPSDLQGGDPVRFYRADPGRREQGDWHRRLPRGTDVPALLARGTNGPPVSGVFEYVPLAGGRGAAVTGLAARPEGDALEIPAELGGLPVVEIAAEAFATFSATTPTAELFETRLSFEIRRGPDGSKRPLAVESGDSSPYTNRLAVVVPEGVRRIGERAFDGFLPMESLRLPSTLERIGPAAFATCELLREVDIPTGVREIPAGAFADCAALEAVRFAGPVERIDPFAFGACPALRAVTVPPGAAPDIDPWAFFDSLRARILPRASAASSATEPVQRPPSPLPSGPAAQPPDSSLVTRHPSLRIAERFGHPATVTVTVVDAVGAPVPGAWIAWRFPAPESQRFGVDAVEGLARADSNGVARVEGPHFGVFEAALVDPATGMRFARGTAAVGQRAPGPFDFALKLADTPVARAVGAMTGKRSWWSDAEGWRSEAYAAALLDESAVDALFALDGAPVGLDLARRALLPPLGDGETADCYLRAFRHWPEDVGLALEGIEVLPASRGDVESEKCKGKSDSSGVDFPTLPFQLYPFNLQPSNPSSLYLRALPPWSSGRRRRVGHLLPPPCDWSSTNGWTGAAPAPWHALADSAPLRVPVRSRGTEGWVEIGPDGTRWSGLHISGFLPVERKPFARLPGIEEDRIWRGFPPQRGFLAVGKTVDGAACLLGPCDLDGRTPCAPNSFPGASRIALFEQSSEAPQFLAGVDTLVVPSFVEEIPDHAFENCGDLRCVVLEPGVRRIGARAFAGCTNLAAVLVLPERAGGKIAFPEVAPDAFSDCGSAPDWIVSTVRGIDVADAPFWRHTPRGLSYIGPRVLDGWLWRAAPLSVRSGSSSFVRLSDSTLTAGTLSVIPPPPDTPSTPSTTRHSSLVTRHWTVPASVAGHPVFDFDAARLPETAARLELPPTLRRADFPGLVPDVVRTADPATDLAFHDREPLLLFLPPGRYWWHPFGVNVGLTRLLPAYADLAAQLAVPHQNRDCGGWLWVPVGDAAAELVGYRGPLPTNGVLRLPAFVGPEDRRPDVPSTDAPPAGARRVVALSPYMFRRHDASTERERGPRFALEIPEGVETIGAFAFENTLRIESVSLPSTLRTLGPGAFSNCGNLKAVDLPASVAAIPAGCFLGCASLKRVRAPGATTVDALAFAGCERLSSLSLAPSAALHPSALLDTPGIPSESEPHAESAAAAEP